MKPTKNEVLSFIYKYQEKGRNSIVARVPINPENMRLIDGIRDHVCPIHRRWRGKNWLRGYRVMDGSERVSVYPRNRATSVEVSLDYWGAPSLKISTVRFIHADRA